LRSIAVFINFFFRLSWALGRGRLRRQQRAAELLVDAFATMPGLTRKLVQNLPQHRGKGTEFVGKQKLPLSFVRARVALQAPALSAQIDEFTDEVHVASLGQVNVARLKTGELVAIKTQLPGVAQEVESQLQLLLLSLRGVRALQGSDFDVEAFEKFLRSSLAGELDYSREAQWQEQLRADLGSIGVKVPRVLKEHSRSDLLVQEYVPGLGVDELLRLPAEERSELAQKLLGVLRHMVTVSGLVHADLHASNWAYLVERQQLVLYDCGSVFRLGAGEKQAARVLLSEAELTPSETLNLFCALGFSREKLAPMQDKLPALSKVLAAPFREPPPWRVRASLDELLGAEKWTFRAAGPPWFLWALRTTSGVLAAVERLGLEADPVTPKKGEIVTRAQKIRVLVTEKNDEIVRVELPARSLAQLEDLVPEDVLEKITLAGVDLAAIKARAIAAGTPVGLLFRLDAGERHYLVELV